MRKKKLNQIGLDIKKSEELSVKLNGLLADFQVFYQNARGFHWNVRGKDFFEMHIKFEELYTDAMLKIDEIAERVLTLGFTPTHNFSDYMDKAEIKPAKNVSGAKNAVGHILEGFRILLEKERDILAFSDGLGDEGTNALMSDYIREQEKLVWMYAAYAA